MNLIVRAILAIVGVWLTWSQLGQLTMMINTHSISVLGLVLLAVGILLILFAIKPNFLRTETLVAVLEMIRQEKRFYTSDANHIAWQKVKIGG